MAKTSPPPKTPPLPQDLVLVGRFGAAHGVRGEIRLKSFTGEPEAIADYAPLYDSTATRRFVITALRHVRDDMFVAKLEGVSSRNDVEGLVNLDLYTHKAQLPPPEEDEFYHSDLIGLAAVLEDGTRLGDVLNVLNFGAGDILEIKPVTGGDTLLFPFTKAVVPVIDLGARQVVVAPPQFSEARDETQEP